MKRIMIICGGQSPEHAISVRSCKNILQAIDQNKYELVVVGITKSGQWVVLDVSDISVEVVANDRLVEIRPGQKDCFWENNTSLGFFDAVFPVLHGPNGEDGSIQGLFKLLEVPFVGCDILSSAVSMDKHFAKRLLQSEKVGVSRWVLIDKGNPEADYSLISGDLGSILFVKPANMGSSVGVSRVSNQMELDAAIKEAFLYDNRVLVEEQVVGKEVECAVLGNHNVVATGVGEVRSGNFYSYEEKYESSSVAEIDIPAKIESEKVEKLRAIAVKSYKALGCCGLARVDMFLTEEGEIIVNEVNTMPGFTSISMYPKLWEEEGLGYPELIDRLIELALEMGR